MMTLAELESELDEAINDYKLEETRYENARRAHTEALNRLNAAQLAFDVAVSEKRKEAPRASDWNMKRNEVRV